MESRKTKRKLPKGLVDTFRSVVPKNPGRAKSTSQSKSALEPELSRVSTRNSFHSILDPLSRRKSVANISERKSLVPGDQELQANEQAPALPPVLDTVPAPSMQESNQDENSDAMLDVQADEMTTPGQFPDREGTTDGPNLLLASLHLPALLGLNYHPQEGYTPIEDEPVLGHTSNRVQSHSHSHSRDPHVHAEADTETASESQFETHVMEELSSKDDYFTYPERRSSKKGWPKKMFKGTSKLSSPGGSSSHVPASPTDVDDDAWSIIDEYELESLKDMNESHPTAPLLSELNRPLHELDEVEVNEFLSHFSRHTREVHLPHAMRHFTRMPQWSDFAYSSDGDEENIMPFAPNETLARRHRRSRFLMHVDRGLYLLEGHDTPEQHHSAPSDAYASLGEDAALDWHPSTSKPSVVQGGGDTSSAQAAAKCLTTHIGKLDSKASSALPTDTARAPTAGAATRGQLLDASPYEVEKAMESPDSDIEMQTGVSTGSAGPSSPAQKPVKRLRMTEECTETPPTLNDEHVDGVAFCVAYILALVEQYAPNDLDEAPITEYRESRARSHIERLYIIAPFWEQLVAYLRALYCWEEPRRTAAAAMIYFVLWYTDMLPTAFFTLLLYYVLQFRYFPQDESLLHRRVHDRMVRGQHANRLAERLKRRSRLDILDLYKRWARTYGVVSQVAAGDVADFHEKIKNLLLWRNPKASRRTAILLAVLVLFVTVSSPALVQKVFLLGCGITFFGLMPLQTLYPRYRRALNPLWWAVLGAPTDAQWAIQLLRSRHSRYQEWLQSGGEPSAGKHPRSMPSDMPPPFTLGDMKMTQLHQKDGLKGPEHVAPAARASERSLMDKRKLDSFLCQHFGVPGHLNVTPTHLYFSPLRVVGSGSKHYLTNLQDMEGLRKTHTTRLWLWDSHGLKISRRGKNTLYLSNMARRDEAFNLLLTLASHLMQDM